MKPAFMRRAAAIGMALLTMPCFSGCMRAVRLKDRAIVQAVGVDYLNDEFKLTFQYFVPEGSGGKTAFDASKLNNNIIESEGKTLTEAVDKASREQGKQIFFGSNKIIILGKSMALEGIDKTIHYFNANHQLDPRVYVMVAENDAREIVSAQIKRGIVPASAIEQMADTALDNHYMSEGRMLDIASRLENQDASIDIPRILLSNENEEPEIHIEGGALFRDNKMVDTLNEQEIQGKLWIRGEMAHNLMVLELPDNQKCSLEVLASRSRIRPQINGDGSVTFKITVWADSALREMIAEQGSPPEKDLLALISDMQEKKIKQLVHLSLQKTIIKNKTDIFKFNNYLRKYQPKFYNQNRDNFDKVIENMSFDVKIICNISRMGLEASGEKR